MSRIRRYEIIQHSPPPFYFTETSIFSPKPISITSFSLHNELDLALDLLTPTPTPTPTIFDLISPFEHLDTITDLVHTHISAKKIQRPLGTDLYLQSLSDRVSALELGVDRLVKEKKPSPSNRKYTWTAEIKSPEKDGLDRKYKLITEIKGGKKKERSYKWTAEIKGKGEDAPVSRKYTFEASTDNGGSEKKDTKDQSNSKIKDEKKVGPARVVEIEDESPPDHGSAVLRQAFAKRAGALEKRRGKKKELSPQDAAAMIQITFRAYLIRRSQALRALRDLAIAKARLKELRSLFNNFSYRRRVARDAEERQRFSEKIIVLLLTVDAIEGADVMVRAARRSMIEELEAMLDVVDPQPQGGGRSVSMKRRTFDLPDGVIQKELAAGVAQVVRMLDQEPNGETFEACL